MPIVKRQTTAPAPKRPAKANAWGMIDAIRMLTYGESGSGKTTLWSSFPGPIRVYVCSGGKKAGELRSIDTPEMRAKVDPVIIETVDQLREELEEQASKFATTVLDHASGFADLVLKEILGINEIPTQKSWGMASQQQYGQQALQCKEFFRTLLNLPGHVVIVAQQRTFGGDDAQSDLIKPTVGAALSPSLAGWLNPACDFVVQTFKRPRMNTATNKINGKDVKTTSRGKGIEYCLRCEPHDVFITKFRLPKGRTLPDVIVDPDFSKILKVIQG